MGKAVKRNRARRVLRRALSRITFDRRQSFDIILVARGKTAHMKSYQITPLIKERMTRSGIIYDQ